MNVVLINNVLILSSFCNDNNNKKNAKFYWKEQKRVLFQVFKNFRIHMHDFYRSLCMDQEPRN